MDQISGLTEIIEADRTAELVHCRFPGQRIEITADLVGVDADAVTCAILQYDVPGEIRVIEMRISGEERGGKVRVRMELDPVRQEDLATPRWAPKIGILEGGELRFVPVKCRSRSRRFLINFRNSHLDMDDGFVLFPFINKRGRLKISYREASEYDGIGTRIKELVALVLYRVFGALYRKKAQFVVYEKFSATAQDNSFYFFRYCMEQLPASERRHVYYIIDKRSPDYQYVSKYGSNVIQFMSIRHMIYAMACRILISTDTVQHLYAWKSKQNPVKTRIEKKPEMFLQHGVTMLKDVSSSFGVDGMYPMKYFVTTSRAEQAVVAEHLGYSPEQAPILGFARWDALRDTSGSDGRNILIMPTWRLWLENADDEEFESSEYYRGYMDVFTSRRFETILEKNDLTAILYLHPKFADRFGSFAKLEGGRIECVRFGEKRLNDLIMNCSLFITDYSSVCWDVLYMNKPVLFYQFDYDQYEDLQGSFIDMKESLPGRRSTDAEGLLDSIEESIGDGFTVPQEYSGLLDGYFEYRDSCNSERIYRFLTEHEKDSRSGEEI